MCVGRKGCLNKILPNSNVKFFFICNINTAAKRRYKELKKTSRTINLNQIKQALNKRNLSDKTRSISPLQKHPDAIVVNTTKLSKKAMVANVNSCRKFFKT